MMSFKKIIITVCILSLLTLVGLVGSTYFIKTDRINAQINHSFSQFIPVTSKIQGTITWHLLPRPALEITQIQLNHRDNALNASMLIKHLTYQFQLSALLKGRLLADEIIVDGFNVSIAMTNTNGMPAQTTTNSTSNFKQIDPFSIQFNIKSILFTHGFLIITNGSDALSLSNVQMKLNPPTDKSTPYPMQFKANVSGQSGPHTIQGQLSYKGRALLPSAQPLTQRFSILNTLQLNGQLLVKKISIDALPLSQISSQIALREGVLNLTSLTLLFSSGESIGQLTVDLHSKQLKLNQTTTHLNADDLFTAPKLPIKITGQLQGSVHAAWLLSDWNEPITLRGNLTLNNGSLNGVDLEHVKQALINNQASPASRAHLVLPFADYPGQTPFELLTIEYQLNPSHQVNYSVFLQSKALVFDSQGHINLANHTLNGQVWTTLDANNKPQTLHALHTTSPFYLSGTLDAPILKSQRHTMAPAPHK